MKSCIRPRSTAPMVMSRRARCAEGTIIVRSTCQPTQPAVSTARPASAGLRQRCHRVCVRGRSIASLISPVSQTPCQPEKRRNPCPHVMDCTFMDMNSDTLLICDDDPDVLIAARLALQPLGCAIEMAGSPADLRARLERGPVTALLLDLNFTRGAADGSEGLALLDGIRRDDPTLSAVLMTGFGTVGLAVEALKRGAVDFVLKPWQNDKLIATLSAALSLTRAKREARDLQRRNDGLATEAPDGAIIGQSPAMARIFEV